MNLRRTLPSLLLAAWLALSLAVAAEAAPRRAPDQAAKARALVKGVAGAQSTAARERALLRVFRALRAGVYTGVGKAVVRGAERRSTDVFLYRTEVRAIAGGLGTDRALDGDALAARIGALGVKRRDGAALTAADLVGPLPGAVRRAKASRRSRAALGTLLVAELARRAKRPLGGEKARFDALQAWLIGAEVLSAHGGRTRALAQATAAQDARPCFPGQGRVKKLVDGFGIFGDVVSEGLETAGNLGAGPLHALGLAALIDVQATRTGQVSETHYGPGHPATFGRQPGGRLVFQVGVQMVAEPHDRLIRCGPLAGMKFPKKGPIPDIPINWDGLVTNGLRILGFHGTVTRKDEKTGPDGVAVLTFQPHDEPVPGLGEERLVVGVLQPEAEVFTGLGNKFGNFNEIVNSFNVTLPFSIGAHVPRGYKFRAQTPEICFYLDSCQPHSERVTFTYTASSCGWNPYGTVWSGLRHARSNNSGEIEEDEEPIEFVLQKDTLATEFRPPPFGDNDNRVDFKLLAGGHPAQMQVDSYYSNNFAPGGELYRVFTDKRTVPVEEDTSCPPIPPLVGQVAP